MSQAAIPCPVLTTWMTPELIVLENPIGSGQTDPVTEEAGPSQFHNDKFWDERSLDEELQKKDLQQEIIDREVKEFNKAAERGEDFSRPFEMKYWIPIIKAEVIHPSLLRRT